MKYKNQTFVFDEYLNTQNLFKIVFRLLAPIHIFIDHSWNVCSNSSRFLPSASHPDPQLHRAKPQNAADSKMN